MNPRLLLFALLLVSSAADGLVAAQPPAEIDFARQIAPVFQGHCIKCHGAEKQKGKFRLDRRANMLRGGDSAEPAIVPGDPKASYLLKLIRHEEADLEMPAEGDPLSAGQVALIERWIAEGAPTPDSYGPDVEAIATDHWSMQPLEAPSVPSGEAHPIDAFIAAKHGKHGLAFNPRATRRDLVRRMFLDMTGLLPTPEEGARFESADVAQLAEYLLASPHYGERWARHWLDVVRFAESAGFETNLERPNAYHYRDYIIRAFNDDKPYNDFVFEQLAGDTVGEDAATGFIVGGAYDKVKGQDKLLQKMQRQDELSDMVSTTATAFLGLTMGCAKCHNHKFDPVSQTDFFAMASVFQGVQHGDRLLRRKDEAARKARAAALQGKIAGIRKTLESYRPPRPAGSTVMIDDRDQGRTRHLAEKRGHGTNPGGKQRGHSDDAGGLDRLPNLSGGTYTWWTNKPGEDVYAYRPGVAGEFRVWLSWGCGWKTHSTDARYLIDRDGDPATRQDQQEIARIDQQRFADGSGDPLPSKPLWSGFKEAGVHTFTPDSILLLRGGDKGTAITADTLILQAPGAGGTQPRLFGPVKADGNEDRFPPAKATALRFTIEKTNNGDNPCIDELEIWAGDVNVARKARPSSSGNYPNNPKHKLEHINDGKYGNGRSWISNEGGRGWVQLEWDEPAVIERITWARDRERQYSDRVPAVYRIDVRENKDAPWVKVAGSQARVGGPRGDDAALNLAGLPPERAAEAKKLLDRIKPLEKQRAALLKNRMVYAGTFSQPREPTRRLFRGDPLAPREVVAPDGIVVLNERLGSFQLPPNAPEQKRRVALAKWIVHPDNPLTARVIVNRLWHYHFGRGIVATPSDFGDMGFRPTHPQLLDWLAAELKENGWSLKHIHRLILTSRTYAQSSSPRNHALEKDAGSQWLWRFPPRRLEAEAIRDNILLVAGSLDRTMYGPSYSLFEPNANYSRNWVPKQEFDQKDLRRMVYALKLRMEHDAIFGAFDCPDGGSIAPVRSRSTTPIQALNLYNSAFVLDQARRFAERARETAVDASAAAQVQAVFHLAFGRGATPAEVADAAALVEQHGLKDLCRAVFNANEFLFMP